jgi:hypothetical protein
VHGLPALDSGVNSDPERVRDAQEPVHILPRRPRPPLESGHAVARLSLAAELEQGLPVRADREVLLAALRDVWLLAQDWRAGLSDTGPGAYAEVRGAVRGDRR